jgi:A/G-specific adenine glycosylase
MPKVPESHRSRAKILQFRGLTAALQTWYRRCQRPLPWRKTSNPYHIWVSEVMLQQTRAAAVVPYYERFLQRFPTVEALAGAADRDLLESWSGLGYYSRARNLREAARQIVIERHGVLPAGHEQWAALPGVGPYTAAAVASIAFGDPVAVLDGNVARAAARLANHSGDIRSPRVREELRRYMQALLDRRNPGEFNQAVMELGATVCLPRRPLCRACPVAKYCEAFRLGRQEELPVKRPRQTPVRIEMNVGVVERNGSLLLRQRPAGLSLMPGFWELPQIEGRDLAPLRLAAGEPLHSFRHSITHRTYKITVRKATLRGPRPPGYQWIRRRELHTLPLTTITRKALNIG